MLPMGVESLDRRARSGGLSRDATQTRNESSRAYFSARAYQKGMCLTSMLDARGLPLREFFESRLPNCKEMQKSWNTCGVPLIVPVEPVAWTLVGAAFDYRVRYLFTITRPERFVAALGAGQEFEVPFANLASQLAQFTSNNHPCGALMSPSAEAELARFCYVLAMYESLFRAAVVNSPLFSLGAKASADEQLALAPPPAVADLVALTGAAVAAMGHLFKKSMISNPVFAGSLDVGGADADLIINRCLIDIKTTKNRSLDRRTAYQLVGYLLLDYENQYRINSLGFYLSRIPALIVWPVDEAIAIMSNGHETVSSLRNGLKVFLARM